MSVKKSSRTSKKKPDIAEMVLTPSVPPPRRPPWVAFVFFLLFISLAIVSYAVYVVIDQQTHVVDVVQTLSDEVALQQQLQSLDVKEDGLRYVESQVPGLFMAYTPCAPRFTGACDDLMIYRLTEDGSKEVIIPSVRVFPEAPRTNELLQPITMRAEGRYLVFGAWAFGANRSPNDERIWIYDAMNADLIGTVELPDNAVFSEDYHYAAFARDEDHDIRSVEVFDLWTRDNIVDATANDGQTFKGPDGKATITWLATNTIAVIEYALPKDASSTPQIIGEREIAF